MAVIAFSEVEPGATAGFAFDDLVVRVGFGNWTRYGRQCQSEEDVRHGGFLSGCFDTELSDIEGDGGSFEAFRAFTDNSWTDGDKSGEHLMVTVCAFDGE